MNGELYPKQFSMKYQAEPSIVSEAGLLIVNV